jgi:hypothetical protein
VTVEAFAGSSVVGTAATAAAAARLRLSDSIANNPAGRELTVNFGKSSQNLGSNFLYGMAAE